MCGCLSDICLIILSVLFPPLPVWIRRGLCSCDSLINILLCILGYFPGLIHSWYIIAKYPPYSYDVKAVYIQRPDLENQIHCHHHHHPAPNAPAPAPLNAQPQPHAQPSYGAVNEGSSAPPAYSEIDRK